MAERLSDKEWARTLKALARHNGHQRSAAKDLGIGRPAIASRILNARARGLEVPVASIQCVAGDTAGAVIARAERALPMLRELFGVSDAR